MVGVRWRALSSPPGLALGDCVCAASGRPDVRPMAHGSTRHAASAAGSVHAILLVSTMCALATASSAAPSSTMISDDRAVAFWRWLHDSGAGNASGTGDDAVSPKAIRWEGSGRGGASWSDLALTTLLGALTLLGMRAECGASHGEGEDEGEGKGEGEAEVEAKSGSVLPRPRPRLGVGSMPDSSPSFELHGFDGAVRISAGGAISPASPHDLLLNLPSTSSLLLDLPSISPGGWSWSASSGTRRSTRWTPARRARLPRQRARRRRRGQRGWGRSGVKSSRAAGWAWMGR